jgi:hypothetical protein
MNGDVRISTSKDKLSTPAVQNSIAGVTATTTAMGITTFSTNQRGDGSWQ